VTGSAASTRGLSPRGIVLAAGRDVVATPRPPADARFLGVAKVRLIRAFVAGGDTSTI